MIILTSCLKLSNLWYSLYRHLLRELSQAFWLRGISRDVSAYI